MEPVYQTKSGRKIYPPTFPGDKSRIHTQSTLTAGEDPHDVREVTPEDVIIVEQTIWSTGSGDERGHGGADQHQTQGEGEAGTDVFGTAMTHQTTVTQPAVSQETQPATALPERSPSHRGAEPTWPSQASDQRATDEVQNRLEDSPRIPPSGTVARFDEEVQNPIVSVQWPNSTQFAHITEGLNAARRVRIRLPNSVDERESPRRCYIPFAS